MAAKLLNLAISLDIEVMNTAGLSLAMEVKAQREVRQLSPAAVKGRPYLEDGTHQSASQHISSSPKSTLDTSRCGSQRTKPRPIRSMAALRKAVLAVGVFFSMVVEAVEVGVLTDVELALLA